MKFSMQKLSGMLVVTLVTCFSLASVVMAQDNEEKYYIRLHGAEQNITGDFDGKTGGVFVDAKQIHVVAPDLDSATGYGITIGGQRGRLFGEISFFTADHDSSIDSDISMTISGLPYKVADIYSVGKTTNDRFSLDFKYALLDPDKCKIVPYALLGVSRDRFRVQNGAAIIIEDDTKTTDVNETSYGRADADYKGWGYKIGAGLLCRFTDHLALEGLYTISRTDLDRVSASAQTRDPKFRVNSQVFDISLNYYF